MNGAVRCPRFDSCSAPICPLDPEWPSAQHINGERVCGLLTELVKAGGRQRLNTILSTDQLATLVREAPKVEVRWSDVRRRLKASSSKASRIERGKALKSTALSTNYEAPLPYPLPILSNDGGSPLVGGVSEVPA